MLHQGELPQNGIGSLLCPDILVQPPCEFVEDRAFGGFEEIADQSLIFSSFELRREAGIDLSSDEEISYASSRWLRNTHPPTLKARNKFLSSG